MAEPFRDAGTPVIWLDILCLPSLVALLQVADLTRFRTVQYANVSPWIRPFVPLLPRLLRLRFRQILWLDYGTRTDDDRCLYETVVERFWTFWRTVENSAVVSEAVNRFASAFGYAPVKIRKHLAERAFEILIRPIELCETARLMGTGGDRLILQRTDFLDGLRRLYPELAISDYSLRLMQVRPARRAHYYFDRVVFPSYGQSPLMRHVNTALRVIAPIATASVGAACSWFDRKQSTIRRAICKPGILVYYSQSHFKPGTPSDLYWWPHTRIRSESIIVLLRADLDAISLERLRAAGVTFAIWLNNPISALRKLLKSRAEGGDCLVLTPSVFGAIGAVGAYLSAFRLLTSFASPWVRIALAEFHNRTSWYADIYARYGIKLVWSMEDSDRDKMVAIQAIAKSGGMKIGSHTSYFSVPIAVNDHAEDVLFAWGEDSAVRFAEHYCNGAFHITGNPFSDDSSVLEHERDRLTDRIKDRFVLGYMDQAAIMDIPMGPDAHRQMWKVFDNLMEARPNLVILWKPKNPLVALKAVRRLYPKIDEKLAVGQVVIASSPQYRRLPPIAIGRISDIVVGIGLSTAAIECALIGIPAVCFNPAGLLGNGYIAKVRDQFVFTDQTVLEKRLKALMNGAPYDSDGAIAKFLDKVDPYRDDGAALRSGRIVQAYYREISAGKAVSDIRAAVENEFPTWQPDTEVTIEPASAESRK